MKGLAQWFCSVCVAVAVAAPGDAQTVLHVDASAAPGGDGSSWPLAFQDLEPALAVARGAPGSVDEIWVASGSYVPSRELTAGVPRSKSFELADGVAVYGGFDGTETELAQRDFVQNVTVLTGDLGAARAFHVVTAQECGAGTRLDGFTVREGLADAAACGQLVLDAVGAGVVVLLGELTLENCRFVENEARAGGAGFFFVAGATVRGCVFESNEATCESGALALQGWTNGLPVVAEAWTIESCIFRANRATWRGGALRLLFADAIVRGCLFESNEITSAQAGGALDVDTAVEVAIPQVAIEDCTFFANRAVPVPGGFSVGGGMHSAWAEITLRRCTFRENEATLGGGATLEQPERIGALVQDCDFIANRADYGGGLRIKEALQEAGGYADVIGCRFLGNSASEEAGGLDFSESAGTAANCLFSGNVAARGGGAGSLDLSPLFVCCTFAGNVALEDGGGLATWTSSPAIVNCTLWGNADTGGMDSSAQVFVFSGSPSVDFTCIQGGWPGAGGTGLVVSDPRFVDALGPDGVAGTEDDDLGFAWGSPCIDAGANASLPPDAWDLDADGDVSELLPIDLEGGPRWKTHASGNGRVDLGALEFDGPFRSR